LAGTALPAVDRWGDRAEEVPVEEGHLPVVGAGWPAGLRRSRSSRPTDPGTGTTPLPFRRAMPDPHDMRHRTMPAGMWFRWNHDIRSGAGWARGRAADHLAAVVLRIVRVFIAVDLVLAAAGTGWLLATGAPGHDVLSYAVVLLLASVPVALPAAFALAAALGAQRLAGLGILTTRLSTVQDAAGMDVLCVDKTGTLTANRLTVTGIAAQPAATDLDVLRLAAAACDEATQDPIDLAILRAATDHGLPPARRDDVVPFDPATKRAEATLHTDHGPVRVTKGAPQVIADLAGQPPDSRVAALAAGGARVLAVALRDADTQWRPVGLLALADPPRPAPTPPPWSPRWPTSAYGW
jgi:P-type E1-E2 ATPase